MKEIGLNFQLDTVLNKFLTHLHYVNQIIAYLYHANRKYNGKTALLETDGLPIVVGNLLNFDSAELKTESEIWIFKKAFEELIIGLTLSLIEAHKIFSACDLSRKTRKKPYEEAEIRMLLEKLEKNPGKLNFPTLIDDIEKYTGRNLLHKSEVLTINQIRNCLVHRNGIVSRKDVNSKSTNELILKYIDLVNFADKDGELIEMKWEHKREPFIITKIGFQNREKEIAFKFGERVRLDQNLFNGVNYTCIFFILNIYELCQAVKEEMSAPEK